ncbi:hypothetical protein HanHA300_Chr00c0017g0682771 [Helianthus annuus]|nr:hypothetical protein HanHA300_Chr00c0017g0682771 [Helianthus annuus]KAJ0756679.1 hypothetical protein HanLR1_Chr04g0129861 [Helianthus annuus]KAJ0760428.1 hypothetical protein HanOQP8_Chr04g0137891 [Helianthus annuus]
MDRGFNKLPIITSSMIYTTVMSPESYYHYLQALHLQLSLISYHQKIELGFLLPPRALRPWKREVPPPALSISSRHRRRLRSTPFRPLTHTGATN